MVVFRILLLAAILAAPSAPASTGEAADDTVAAAKVAAGITAYERGDFLAARDIWLPLAQAGDAEAQFRLGRLYDVGEGVAQDGPKAIDWYERAFKQGHFKAANNLGFLFDDGSLVERDYRKARQYYRFAIDHFHPTAMFNMGLMYFGGHGVKRDFQEGFKWLFIAKYFGAKDVDQMVNEFLRYTSERDRQIGGIKAREWLSSHPR